MFRLLAVVMILTLVVLAGCGGGGGQGASGSQGSAGAGNAGNGQKLLAQTSVGSNNAPGCATCHSTEAGKTLVGPTMAGIGTRAAQIVTSADYKGAAKDAAGYLNESIVQPDAYVEKGFSPGIMYQNYGKDLNAQQINDLVAYLVSLK